MGRREIFIEKREENTRVTRRSLSHNSHWWKSKFFLNSWHTFKKRHPKGLYRHLGWFYFNTNFNNQISTALEKEETRIQIKIGNRTFLENCQNPTLVVISLMYLYMIFMYVINFYMCIYDLYYFMWALIINSL